VQLFEKIATHFDPVELEEIRKVDEEDQQGGRNSDIPFQHCPFSRYHACTVSLFRLPYPDRYRLTILDSVRMCTGDKRERAKQNDGEKG